MDLKLLGTRRTLHLNVKRVMSTVAYLVVLLGAMSFVSSSVVQTSTPVGIITSGSMEPILNIGDIVFIQPTKIEPEAAAEHN